jgi:DNA-directed RNA polymerase subunit RPC12/RpoP
MSGMSKIVKCVDCGKEFPRKGLNRNFRCPDCAFKKMRAVLTQMYEKSGPEYEHWKSAMLANLSRIEAGVKGG